MISIYDIRNARLSDIPELKRLWMETFGDEAIITDRFFDRVYTADNAFVAAINDVPVAMLFLIPAELKLHNANYKAGYIYAVATDVEHRGNGLMKQLEECACKKARLDGMSAVALAPASTSLFNMYEKIGYKTVFYKESIIVTPIFTENFELLDCKEECFTDLRDELLDKYISCFDFTANGKSYRYDSLKDDSEILLYRDTDFCGYIVGKKDGSSYEFSETSLPADALARAAYAVGERYHGLKKFMVINRFGRRSGYGMLKSLDDKINIFDLQGLNPYMNLMLE